MGDTSRMSAEEQSEQVSSSSEFDGHGVLREREREADEGAVALPSALGAWLEARIASAAGEVLVSASAQANRWVLRVEQGNGASMIELPMRGEHASSEVASSVRRWARGHGLSARTEPGRALEWRVWLAPLARS